MRPLAALLVALSADAFADPLDAADASTDPRLQTVVVTATRSKQTAFDLPASIDSVSLQDPTANTPGFNPSEYLQGVPGLIARDRQNYAQDEQISIRGFGARSTFGVRGVRIYQDGIPATAPDGQGQVSAFSLDSGDRIEVLRGPFSALYGNSSGGVIQIFTADGQGPTEYRGTLERRRLRHLSRRRQRARRQRRHWLQCGFFALLYRQLPRPRACRARERQCKDHLQRRQRQAS